MIKRIRAYFKRKAKVRKYVGKVRDEVIPMDYVPAEYYDEVYEKVHR